MIKGKWFRELERVESRERAEELGVEISEGHPLAVLYRMVSVYWGWGSAGSKTRPDVASWSPSLYGFTDELRVGGRDLHHAPLPDGRDIGRTIEKWRSAVISVGSAGTQNFIPVRSCAGYSPLAFVYPRATPRSLAFAMSEPVFCHRTPFSSPPSRSRISSRLARNSWVRRWIRSKNTVKHRRSRAVAQALTASPDSLIENKCRGTATQNRRGRCCNVGSGGIV